MENSEEGKTYHKTPPQKQFWTRPPTMRRFPPCVCPRPVIFLRGNGHSPDQSHSQRPPKLFLEGALYSTFPPPLKSHDTFVPPPRLSLANSYSKEFVLLPESMRIQCTCDLFLQSSMDAAVLGGRSPTSISSAQVASLCSARIEKAQQCSQGEQFVRCCPGPTCACEGFSSGGQQGGQQQFATQTFRIHLLGVECTRSERKRHININLFGR